MLPRLTDDQRQAIQWLLGQQAGAIGRWQLIWLGLSSAMVSHLLDQSPWRRVHAGVYVETGREQGHLTDCWAAAIAVCRRDLERAIGLPPLDAALLAREEAGEAAVVTGLSAANLRGLTEVVPEAPELLVDSQTHRRRDGMTLVRGDIAPIHWQREGGLLIATGPRLVWDAAWTSRSSPTAGHVLRHVAIAADRLRVLAVEQLCGVVEEPSAHLLPSKVSRLLRGVAEELMPGFSHSATEAMAREIVTDVADDFGLRVEPRPHAVRDGERIIAEADIAIPEIRHDVEVDGPHHRHPDQRRTDAARDRRMNRIDWTVDRHDAEWIHAERMAFRRAVVTWLQKLEDDAA